MERIKVVVRYRNGKIMKGFSNNFFPNKNHFHLVPADNPNAKPIEVLVKELKAVFVVRDFTGDSQHNERKEYDVGERPSGRKVKVTFQDGEVLVGSTLGYNLNQVCFSIVPADRQSNNIRIFIVLSAVKDISSVDAIEKSAPAGFSYRAQV